MLGFVAPLGALDHPADNPLSRAVRMRLSLVTSTSSCRPASVSGRTKPSRCLYSSLRMRMLFKLLLWLNITATSSIILFISTGTKSVASPRSHSWISIVIKVSLVRRARQSAARPFAFHCRDRVISNLDMVTLVRRAPQSSIRPSMHRSNETGSKSLPGRRELEEYTNPVSSIFCLLHISRTRIRCCSLLIRDAGGIELRANSEWAGAECTTGRKLVLDETGWAGLPLTRCERRRKAYKGIPSTW